MGANEYLLGNSNSLTKEELSQRAAANQVFASLNPNSSYANTAQQMSNTYADILNKWSELGAAANTIGNNNNGNDASNSLFTNGLDTAKFVLSGLNSWMNYKNAKEALKFNKEAFYQQQANWNETYNQKLKEYNTALADRLRARAAFETGNQNAYNDEIAANSARRGETGNSSSSYLNYQRSAYNNPTTTTTSANAVAATPSTVVNKDTNVDK